MYLFFNFYFYVLSFNQYSANVKRKTNYQKNQNKYKNENKQICCICKLVAKRYR